MTAKNPKILCVDDEPANLDLLEALLVPQGYAVIKAENGNEALTIIEEQKIDLVLLDVMMPEIDGFEVCKKMKGNERYRNVPIIMITATSATDDRVKGIQSGAEDFISKPIDSTEVLARIRALLKIKDLNARLASVYNDITNMISFEEAMVMSFSPLTFDFLTKIDELVNHILRNKPDMTDKPEVVLVGFVDDKNMWQWYRFDAVPRFMNMTWIKKDIFHSIPKPVGCETRIFYTNEQEGEISTHQQLIEQLRSLPLKKVSNMVGVSSEMFCIIALNYGKVVSRYDAEILNSSVMQSLFMKSLALRVKETESAFEYLVFALGRAAEATDYDTGNHVQRIGEYCATIARGIGMSEKFSNIIRIQATLHDVGKIRIHTDILKNPKRLTTEEYDEIKKHPLTGATILGDHARLKLAKKIALSHHERWDGSGYPYGLKGDQIPLEGRILTIADQYDVMRSPRAYKPAFDHEKTCEIILKGDGRTMPQHFDPQVLRAFKETASQFEKIYERLKG